MRGVPTVQTIASPPRSFERPDRLIFGDVAVAQSEWTQKKLLDAFAAEKIPAPRIEVIYPPAPEVTLPSEQEQDRARAIFGCHGAQPLFVYPGDLEVSRGAQTVIELSHRIREQVPFARVVIAYREKTSRASERAEQLADQCNLEVVRFGCDVENIHALVAAATAIVFPVDDLYGKVDLPIVLLEALRLGTPVLALDEGPLSSLEGALRLPNDQDVWLAEMSRLALDGRAHEIQREKGYQAVQTHYAPALVARKYQAIYRDLLD
jgi:phosphatidylinositol alpha-1,6-mannosyltransferase